MSEARSQAAPRGCCNRRKLARSVGSDPLGSPLNHILRDYISATRDEDVVHIINHHCSYAEAKIELEDGSHESGTDYASPLRKRFGASGTNNWSKTGVRPRQEFRQVLDAH